MSMLRDEKMGHEFGPETMKRYKRQKPEDLLLELSSDVADLMCTKLKNGVELDREYLREMMFRTYHSLTLIRNKIIEEEEN